MIKIILVVAMGGILTLSGFAQMDTIWTKTFGGLYSDGGKSVCETSDGGFIIAGYTFSYGAGNPNVYLIKTDSAGNRQWEKVFGDTSWSYGFSVCQTQDGGYAITGLLAMKESGSEDIVLIKTDDHGNLLWTRIYGGILADQGRSLCQMNDGGYMIAGYTQSLGAGEEDLVVVRTDSVGELMSIRSVGGARSEIGEAIQKTSDGTLVIIGATGSPTLSSINSDFYLTHISHDGSIDWSRAYGTSGTLAYDWGTGVCQTNDNGFLSIGSSNTSSPLDIYVVKTTSNGTKVWAGNYGQPFYEYGNSVCNVHDGGFLLCGVTKSFETTSNDIYVVKIDSAGNKVWEKQFGGQKNEWGNAIVKTRDGHYVIIGQTDSYGAGSRDVYLIKVGTLEPQFHGEPCIGAIPFEVKFFDRSIGNPTSWQWDLNNDGVIESSDRDPLFTYDHEGWYSVTLTVSNGFETKTITLENYILAINGVQALYDDGWNLISLPVIPDTAITFPASWKYTGSYEEEDALEYGTGYWAKPPSDVLYSGTPVTIDTFDVSSRWNIIGSISVPVPVAAIGSIPPAVVTSDFYRYDPRRGYIASDTIEPGKGYWVKASQESKLILSAGATVLRSSIVISSDGSSPPQPPDPVTRTTNTPPGEFILKQNFPNPFNPTTVIRYELPSEADIRLAVYNILGQPVCVLADERQSAGVKSVEWNAQAYPSGLYLYRLDAVDVDKVTRRFFQMGKMALVK